MAKLTIQQWIKNLWDATITGGCSAAIAASGLAGVHATGVIKVDPLDLNQTIGVFLSGAGWELIRYLKSHPSPDIGNDVSANETTKTKE